MRPLIPVPAKGEKLRATWGTQVSNRVNELCAMAPANMLARDGFGGLGAQPLPANLRDRPAAGASQLMPFDLSASVETSQDGTQKRLVVKCVNGQVIWCEPTLTSHQDDTPGVETDTAPWVTIYTGEWASAIQSGTYAIFLHYKITIGPTWDSGTAPLPFSGNKIYQKVTAEIQSSIGASPTTFPYGTTGFFYNVPPAETLVAWIPLGSVTVSSSGAVSTAQSFHGNLVLSDLLIAGGSGGGGANPDATSSLSGCWKIGTVEIQGVTSKQLQDCYYNVGGITKQAANQTVPDNATGYLCAVFSASGVTVAVYASLGSIQADDTKYVVPLYEMENGEVVLDMRNAPQIQVFEGTL